MRRKTAVRIIYDFLDTKNAFEKMWHDGLFQKLYERGIDFYIWNVLLAYMLTCQAMFCSGGLGQTSLTLLKEHVRAGLFPLKCFYAILMNC